MNTNICHFACQNNIWINILLTHHCNLNCKGCAGFAPLSQPFYVTCRQIVNDFVKLKKIFGNAGYSFCFSYLGGEPLLNPQFDKIIKKMRKIFPDSYQDLLTNGILLNEKNDEFWQLIKKCNINVLVTKYPIDIDREKYETIANKNGVNIQYRIINSNKVYNLKNKKIKYIKCVNNGFSWAKNIIDLSGGQDYKKRITECSLYGGLVYSNGNLYSCCIHAYIQTFIDYFKVNVQITKDDYVSIKEISSAEEIFEFSNRPKPLCRYCKKDYVTILEGHRTEWSFSEKKISEWT